MFLKNKGAMNGQFTHFSLIDDSINPMYEFTKTVITPNLQ